MPELEHEIQHFIAARLRRQGKVVAARIQAAMALLERLRDNPALSIDEHMKSGSTGLISHEKYGEQALARFELQPINKNHGRRSSHLPDWGPDLLSLLGRGNLPVVDNSIINRAQEVFADELRQLIHMSPIEVSTRGKSAAAMIGEVINEANERGMTGNVAQYLVAAKLALRFPDLEIPRTGASEPDTSSSPERENRMGDLHIGSTVVEIAVGLPDAAHIVKVAETVERTDFDVWVITRSDRVEFWRQEIGNELVHGVRRVTVFGINEFVGQNLGELGTLDRTEVLQQLRQLVNLYNDDWVAVFGPPGIRIELTY